MFFENNNIKFGEEVLKIRKGLKLSRIKVAEISGVNVDTIRNIENGKFNPKFDTLVLLSKVYKINLLLLYSKLTENKTISNFYKEIDYLTIKNNSQKIKDLNIKFKEIKKRGEFKELISSKEIIQMELFLEGQSLMHSNMENKEREALTKFISSIKCFNREFDLNNFRQFPYDFFEIRILYSISVALIHTHEIKLGLDIMLFILSNYIEEECMNTTLVSISMHIRALTLVSYCYHILKDFELSLLYAEKGIEVCNRSSLNYNLPLLFFRKGSALINLKKSDKGYLKKAIYLNHLLKEKELADVYLKEAEKLLDKEIFVDEDIL